jgi:PAS domain S-box-containing protein
MATQTIDQLLRENEELRRRVEEAEEAVRALSAGEVDAVLVHMEREQVYTLESVEKPYRLLIEQVSAAAATLTCEGEIIHGNQRFADLLGEGRESLAGRPICEFVAPESRGTVESLLREGASARAEAGVVLRQGNGSTVSAHLGVSLLREGALGSCLVVVDLTEHRHYVELQRTQRALRDARERLELAQQAGRIGTFDWNTLTGELSFSVTMEEHYGLPPGGFGGRYEDWRPFAHPDDLERVEAEVRQALAGRTELTTEYRIIRPDGEVRWILAKGKIFCAGEGQPLRMLGVSLDITEQKAVQAERERLLALEREARAQAERALRTRDDVLAFVAHDLRNPLLAIEMSASTISTCRTDEARQECLSLIQRGTGEMRRLIGDLLDAARIESGAFDVHAAPTDVASMLHEVCGAFAQRALARGVQLTCEVSSDVPPAEADRDRVLQLLSNLIDNAIKFTGAGGGVRVRAEPAGRFIEVSIADSGSGIAAGELPHIFDRFWKADRGSRSGAGLGLAICKGIVDAHGGHITVESTLGVGTTFRVTLPRAPA